MTTYRLFPATNGPAAPISYSGNFIAGVVFAVRGGGNWFSGYSMWVCASGGQPTAPAKCCLWSVGGNNGLGTGGDPFVVPGSVVTSGTLIPGQWNDILLPSPVQLAPGYSPNINANAGSAYVAAIAVNGNFPDTSSFWTTAIDQGPLHGYLGAGSTVQTPPYLSANGIFSTGSTDPTVALPQQISGTDNFWVDVIVSNTAPPAYAGTYRLYPNQASSNVITSGDAAWNYTIASEISFTQEVTASNIWFFSPGNAITLPTRVDVWKVSSGLSILGNSSPAWTDRNGVAYTAGSKANGCWIKAQVTGIIPAGDYRVSAYNANGHTDANWSPKDAGTDFWNESAGGVGYLGITNGPVSAPNWAASSSGFLFGGTGVSTPPFGAGGATAHSQPPFGLDANGTTSAVAFPQLVAPVGAGTNQTQNYWVDIEVSIPSAAALSAAPVLTVVARDTVLPSAHLSTSPVLTASGIRSVLAHAALMAPGSLTVAGSRTAVARAAMAAPGALTASGSVSGIATVNGAAALRASPALAAATLSNAQNQLDGLWAIYVAAKQAAITARDNWQMMRQAGGTDGTAGFLFAGFYDADQAADVAYENWRKFQQVVYPGARG